MGCGVVWCGEVWCGVCHLPSLTHSLTHSLTLGSKVFDLNTSVAVLASRLGVNSTTRRRIIAGKAFGKKVRGRKKLPLTPQRVNAIRDCLLKTLPEAVEIYRLAELTLVDLKIDFGYYNGLQERLTSKSWWLDLEEED